jgi:succinylarginine dihydrolase
VKVRLVVTPGTRAQFEVVRRFLLSDAVRGVVCATVVDATSATSSATSSAPHMMWRTASTAVSSSVIRSAGEPNGRPNAAASAAASWKLSLHRNSPRDYRI